MACHKWYLQTIGYQPLMANKGKRKSETNILKLQAKNSSSRERGPVRLWISKGRRWGEYRTPNTFLHHPYGFLEFVCMVPASTYLRIYTLFGWIWLLDQRGREKKLLTQNHAEQKDAQHNIYPTTWHSQANGIHIRK